MKTFPFAILAGIFCFSSPSMAAAGPNETGEGSEVLRRPEITIDLKGEALIRGTEMLLGDLARVRSKGTRTTEHLRAIKLGPAPRGSWARWVGRDEVRRALVATGLSPKQFQIQGAARTQVQAATERIRPEEVISAAESVLRALLQDEGESDVVWNVLHKPRVAVVPLARKSRRLVARPVARKLGRMAASIQVDVVVDGKVVSSLPVQFRVVRYREVLVALQTIATSAPVTASLVTTKRVEVSRISGKPLSFPDQVRGLVASRVIRAGEVISDTSVTQPAVIRKGDQVQVVAAVGKVRIETVGVAQANGYIGQRIPVRVGNRKVPIYGEVYGTGLVVLRQPASKRNHNRGR